MKDGIYNVDIYWPDELTETIKNLLSDRMTIARTDHYDRRVEKYGFNFGVYKAALFGEVVEATVSAGKVVKMVTRISNKYDNGEDICFVVSICWNPEAEVNVAIVRTVWPNNGDDYHLTKDKAKYVEA